MNFLSKKYVIAILALYSSALLQGAASLTLANERLNGARFSDLCFAAQERCSANVSGYVIETAEKVAGAGQLEAVLKDKLEWKGGAIDTSGEKCDGAPDFCNTPQEHILFQDHLVKVILKPKYSGAVGNAENPTDILIVPLHHHTNTHALNIQNFQHHELLDHIANVAELLAEHLVGDSKVYTLQTRNGDQQGVRHLHVHFKADAILNVNIVRALCRTNEQQDLEHVQQTVLVPQSECSYRAVGTVIAAVVGVGLGALAVYGLYSWWKKQ